jgi:erythromycin esterase-like protein
MVDLQKSRSDYAKRDGRVAEDEFFFAEQNPRLVTNAERYYRAMFSGRHNTWNLRDEHMVDTIAALTEYLDRHRGSETKCVVWAHNSHLGDARTTDAAEQGEWNVGQLCRQRWGERVFNVGFSTYTGTVTAAHDWDGPAERMRVNPKMDDSYESLFHEVGLPRFLLTLRDADASHADVIAQLRQPRLQRAIGGDLPPAHRAD